MESGTIATRKLQIGKKCSVGLGLNKKNIKKVKVQWLGSFWGMIT